MIAVIYVNWSMRSVTVPKGNKLKKPDDCWVLTLKLTHWLLHRENLHHQRWFSSSKHNCLSWYLFCWKSHANFRACHWWICLKIITVHPPSLVNSIPPLFLMKTLTSSCWQSRTSSAHLLQLTLFHVIWRLPPSNLCWKKITWQKSFEKQPPISNLRFLSKILEKVVFYKLLSHLQGNNLSNPFQSIEQEIAPRPFCYVL